MFVLWGSLLQHGRGGGVEAIDDIVVDGEGFAGSFVVLGRGGVPTLGALWERGSASPTQR